MQQFVNECNRVQLEFDWVQLSAVEFSWVQQSWIHMSAVECSSIQLSATECNWNSVQCSLYWVECNCNSVECNCNSVECNFIFCWFSTIVRFVVLIWCQDQDNLSSPKTSWAASAYLLFLLCLAQLQSHFCDAEALLSAFLQCL